VASYLACGLWQGGFARARFLQDEVVEPVGHAQWVFTIPKMLRIYFLHHRELLGVLSLAAYETVKELMTAAVEEKGFRVPEGPYRAALRRRWAEMIRRVYEATPLRKPDARDRLHHTARTHRPHPRDVSARQPSPSLHTALRADFTHGPGDSWLSAAEEPVPEPQPGRPDVRREARRARPE
jgi:hypothetical protein